MGRFVALVAIFAGLLSIWVGREDIIAGATPNIDGDWRFELVTTDSAYHPYIGLRQVFSINIRKEKLSLTGDGEIKSDSKTKSMPSGSVRLTDISGKLDPPFFNGQTLWTSRLHFSSISKKRQSTGEIFIRWNAASATGTFYWNAADSHGSVTASRE